MMVLPSVVKKMVGNQAEREWRERTDQIKRRHKWLWRFRP